MRYTTISIPVAQKSQKKRKKRRTKAEIRRDKGEITREQTFKNAFLPKKTSIQVEPIKVDKTFKAHQQPANHTFDNCHPPVRLDIEMNDNMSRYFHFMTKAEDWQTYRTQNLTPLKKEQEFFYVPKKMFECLHTFFPETIHNLYLRDQFLAVLHLIYTRTMFADKREKRNTYKKIKGLGKYFAPIHSTTLRDIVGNDYKKIVDILSTEEKFWCDYEGDMVTRPAIIEIDHYYKINEQSKGYRFKKPKALTRFERVPVRTRKMCKRIIARKEKIATNSYLSKRTYEVFQRLTFSPDVYKYLAKMRSEAISEKDNELVDIYEFHVQKFVDGDFYISFDPKGNRLHSNLTNMPSVLKNFLIVKETGEKLVQVDIRNSQPLIFCAVLQEEGVEGADVEEFIELCEEGTIYDTIMKEMSWKGTRREFKTTFFGEVFYCSTWTMWKSKIGEFFKSRFKNVYKFLEIQKLNGKSYLPCKMQQLESKLVVKNVLGGLHRNTRKRDAGAGGIFLSIHDSILCLEKDLKRTKKLFTKVFSDKVGLDISLQVDTYTKTWQELIPENVREMFKTRRGGNTTLIEDVKSLDFSVLVSFGGVDLLSEEELIFEHFMENFKLSEEYFSQIWKV